MVQSVRGGHFSRMTRLVNFARFQWGGGLGGSGRLAPSLAGKHSNVMLQSVKVQYIKLVPAKTPNSMDVKIGETHAIVQCLLWCPAVWGKSSRAKYHVVVAALTCCFSCLSCAAMHIVK